ncbi:DUF2586 family protein [Bernardetia sp. Wsw4-3y2]|uniref:DUF2586 family protein n=1 Tax=Bernardetia sp. Wsw4-3y2 TaxID=3127471 RepID=UPI0030D538F5
MAEIIFERTDGNLGRLPASEDATSGLLIYDLDTTETRIVTTNVKDAETQLGTTLWGKYKQFVIDFFSLQPSATLYIDIHEPTVFPTFSEIIELQRFAEGKIRQLGIVLIGDVDYEMFTTSIEVTQAHISTIQTQADALRAENMPLQIIYAGHTNFFATLSSFPDCRTFSSSDVSVCIVAPQKVITGDTLTNTIFVPRVGIALGATAYSKVNENIGWVENINVGNLEGMNSPQIAINSLTTSIVGLTTTDLNTLTEKGYIFVRKYTGLSGSYLNDSPTATALTSDFAYIENNRTLDKAIRQTRILLLPSLNAPVYLNPDGTLTAKDISRLSVTSRKALEQMQRDGEVSNFSIFIDPNQNVLSASEIQIEMSVQPVGVARQLKVKIGFTANVA